MPVLLMGHFSRERTSSRDNSGYWKSHITLKLAGRSIFWFRFCTFHVLLLAASLKQETVTAHLVVAASCCKVKECNKMELLKCFFGLSWLSINIWLGNEPYSSKNVFEFDFFFEKVWEISCQLVRTWDKLWNCETKSWDLAGLIFKKIENCY